MVVVVVAVVVGAVRGCVLPNMLPSSTAVGVDLVAQLKLPKVSKSRSVAATFERLTM